jgi:hypothetical protein
MVNAVMSGCSDCCKDAKDKLGKVNVLLDNYLALNGTWATTCANLATGTG